jgi:hypothetical protein
VPLLGWCHPVAVMVLTSLQKECSFYSTEAALRCQGALDETATAGPAIPAARSTSFALRSCRTAAQKSTRKGVRLPGAGTSST